MLTYLKNYETYELVHFSGNTYTTRTHDSLKISNGKWMWWSQRTGGRSALDYLIKPIRAEKLFLIIDRLFLREQRPQEGLTLKCGSTLVRVPFVQLEYVEIINKRLYFHLTDGSEREVNGALSDYESLLLSRPEFMRPHRSYIVNMLLVSELSPGGIHTFSGKSLPVSRLSFPQIQKDYMKLLCSEMEV